MKRLWQRWLDFLARREGAESLALCRILCGIGLVASVSFVMPSGALAVLWSDATAGGYRSLEDSPWLVQILGGPRPGPAWFLAWATILSGICLTLGYRTRLAAFLSLLFFNTLIRINFHDGSAYDSLLANQLLILIFAGSGATWSLDTRLASGRWSSDQEVAAWPRYVFIIQLVLCYWSTGLQKISGHWLPGGDLSAVYYILQDPFWQRWELTPGLGHFYWVTQLGTAFSWWFEVFAPLLLLAYYFRLTRERPGRLRAFFNCIDYRTCFALAGIGFHLGIHLLMRVGPFSWIILAYYPALWSAAEIRRGIEWCRARFALKRGTPAREGGCLVDGA